MTVIELKQYIYDNNKVEYILEDLGCTRIVDHSDKYTACYPVTGDNPMGVVIKLCPQLNYYSYSRQIHIEDNKDILNLIEDVKKINFVDALKYTHKLLGLSFSYASSIKKEDKKPVKSLIAHFVKADHTGRKRNFKMWETFNILKKIF